MAITNNPIRGKIPPSAAHKRISLWGWSMTLLLSLISECGSLANLDALLADFFENVMVNVEDKEVATNRLNILYIIMKITNNIANFEKIEG